MILFFNIVSFYAMKVIVFSEISEYEPQLYI